MSKRRISSVRLTVEEMNARITPAVLATSLLAVAPVTPDAANVRIADDVTVTIIEVRAADTSDQKDSGDLVGDATLVSLSGEGDNSITFDKSDPAVETIPVDGEYLDDTMCPDDSFYFNLFQEDPLYTDGGTSDSMEDAGTDGVNSDELEMMDGQPGDGSTVYTFGYSFGSEPGNAGEEVAANFRDFAINNAAGGTQDEFFASLESASSSQPAGLPHQDAIASSLATALIQSHGSIDFHFDLNNDARLPVTLNTVLPAAPEQVTTSDAAQQTTERAVTSDAHAMKTETLELNGLFDTRLSPTL
jgi:hypothetical protein